MITKSRHRLVASESQGEDFLLADTEEFVVNSIDEGFTRGFTNLINMKFVIVGGGGYIGYHIGQDLQAKGHTVLLFDIVEPHKDWTMEFSNAKIPFYKGSILSLENLELAFSNADCVIHTASYGMSGLEQLNMDKTEEINVKGTVNVIEACISARVKGLVYTSTFNVVFGGQEIRNGTEEMQYFPLHRHDDHYSRTKAIAEQLVLISDGKMGLRTTALRLAGVMGVKEKRHLPRIINNLWLLKFTYGSRSSLVQFISIDNVVQAHVKAALCLLRKEKVQFVGGQPFFVSDGVPINNFEFFRPLIQGLGYHFPTLNLPTWIMLLYARISIFLVLKLKMSFIPLLTTAEIFKTAITHYFSNTKAEIILDYKPTRPVDMTQIVKYYQRGCRRVGQTPTKLFFPLIFFTFIAFVGILIFFQ